MNQTQLLNRMRVIGCALIVCSHFTIIYVSVLSGVIVHLFADAFTLPYFVKHRMWDMVIMLSFLVTIGVSKLFSYYGT